LKFSYNHEEDRKNILLSVVFLAEEARRIKGVMNDFNLKAETARKN